MVYDPASLAKQSSYSSAVNGEVSDDGVSWNVEGLSTARFPWHLLLKYRESETLVLIYQSLNQVFYFPRHYFQAEGDWLQFRKLVGSKLQRK